MDWWILKQLRAQVLSDLRDFIPSGHFDTKKGDFKLPDNIKSHEHFSEELRWGYLAGSLGKKLFYEPNCTMSPRHISASEVLMNLGMLVSAEAARGAMSQTSELAKSKDLSDGNSATISKQLNQEQIPIFENNIKGAFRQYLRHLEQSEKAPFLPLIEENQQTNSETNAAAKKEKEMPDTKKVFVVHGRDETLRRGFFNFLRAAKLEPLEWSEAIKLTGEASPYIGTVLKVAFNQGQAVVVLLSPDDEVRLSPSLWGSNEKAIEAEYNLQARPNVLFEAGMALAKKPDRTLIVEVGNVKPFSDISGRHTVRLTGDVRKRKDVLQRLQTAGCDVAMDGEDWINVGDFEINRTPNSSKESEYNNPKKLDPEREKVLLEVQKRPKRIHLEISDSINLHPDVVLYHLEELEQAQFIKNQYISGELFDDIPDRNEWNLDRAGRAYLVQNNLIT